MGNAVAGAWNYTASYGWNWRTARAVSGALGSLALPMPPWFRMVVARSLPTRTALHADGQGIWGSAGQVSAGPGGPYPYPCPWKDVTDVVVWRYDHLKVIGIARHGDVAGGGVLELIGWRRLGWLLGTAAAAAVVAVSAVGLGPAGYAPTGLAVGALALVLFTGRAVTARRRRHRFAHPEGWLDSGREDAEGSPLARLRRGRLAAWALRVSPLAGRRARTARRRSLRTARRGRRAAAGPARSASRAPRPSVPHSYVHDGGRH